MADEPLRHPIGRRTALKRLIVAPAALLVACTPEVIAVPPAAVTQAPVAVAPTQPVATTVPTSAPRTPTIAPTSEPATPTTQTPKETLMTRNGAPTSEDRAVAETWLADRFLPTSPNIPFSFVYGGQPSARLLPGWTFSQEQAVLDPNRTMHSYVYADPGTSLEVRADAITYTDYPAAEWVLYLTNNGTTDTPILESIQALDAEFGDSAGSDSAEFNLHYSDGSTAAPTDFKQRRKRLQAEPLILTPNGGRSSDGVMPFFNLERPDGSGIIIAVGWSGQWQASFVRGAGASVRSQAGLELTHLTLHPGEKIRSPRMMLLFWSGEQIHGQNLLRRLLLAHYTPQKDAKPFQGPIWASCSGDLGFNNISEENQLASMQALVDNKVQIECFQMDAGWFENGWPNTGTWEPDPVRFPRGLKPIGELAHKLGLNYILWFEPERVMPGTWLRTHDESWLLAPTGLPQELAYQTDWRLLDLGNPAALTWAKDKISAMIEEYEVDIYRHDFNMHPLYNWRATDAPDRQGITEIRYIEGFYDFWDTLLERHPGLVIDNSASGGRRLDLESISRSVALFRTDYFWVAKADQDMTYALSNWLPVHAQGVHAATDTYTFRSGMGTSVCLAYNFLIGDPWEWLRVRLAEYQSIRQYFYGDFYPLFSGVADKSIWIAYQFDRDDLGEGMAVVFKREGSGNKAITLKLDGLQPAATYELTFADAGATKTATGAELAESGFEVALDGSQASELITYKQSI